MKLVLAAALGALVFSCASAGAADFKPIDCGSTGFDFSDPAYNTDCERSEDPLRVGQSSGSSITDVMSVSNNERTIFFTIVERRITGAPRIYMRYSGLEENFQRVFNEQDVRGFKLLEKKNGYDVAEFSRDISGRDSRCITVQRYTNAMHTGFKRHLIGMGCTVGDLALVYQILQRVDGD
jgi:hypothetical protein